MEAVERAGAANETRPLGLELFPDLAVRSVATRVSLLLLDGEHAQSPIGSCASDRPIVQ